jgi:hypothetical protein
MKIIARQGTIGQEVEVEIPSTPGKTCPLEKNTRHQRAWERVGAMGVVHAV